MDFPWMAALIVAGITVIVSVGVASFSPFKKSRGANGALAFEKLSKEIREHNAKIMAELEETKETLASIEKMLRDVG
ncbi:MAG: hypothetical protein FWE21_10575 [Defluviitaleaceae bacterium]|nr:hypothetical protein [Defluviitaleaceae bacterium]